MAVVNISLPDQMKHYVEGRVSERGYGTTSEYFRDLIREDQKRRDEERLEKLLLEGLESPTAAWSKDIVAHAKSEVRKRIAAKRNSP